MRSTFLRIATVLLLLFVVAAAFLLWRRSQPLFATTDQPFLFEQHPRALNLAGRRPTVAATVAIVRIASSGRISAPAPVPSDNNGDRYPALSLAPDGDAYIAWNSPDHPQIYLARAVSR
ncbi:hypothetical protein [Edaphobacter aggregans]|uniref:hypothetical protein n=1 Tax=Edaphobacter aggregans TaxID=570835 RepID=UPI0005539DD6|nr:hypothetical protein [Edaphobacter aggregans]